MPESMQLKKIGCFLFLFFVLVFVLGTFILQLMLQSFIIYVRYSGWISAYEYVVVAVMLFFLFVFSLLFAKWLTIWLLSLKKRSTAWMTSPKDHSTPKIVFLTVLSVVFVLTLVYWLMPATVMLDEKIISADGRFIGGPYPDKAKLAALKAQGYNAVISLLDPLIFPEEPFLIWQEEKAAREMGIQLIHIPMLRGNVKSLAAIKNIEILAMSKDNKRYYVHGHYGKDRVQYFMKIINQFYQPPRDLIEQPNAFTLERGAGINVDGHLILSPKPTKNEFQTIILTAPNQKIKVPIRTVLSLNPDESSPMIDLDQLFKVHHVTYLSMPVEAFPYDAEKILTVAKRIKSLSGSVLVYSYYMPPQSTVLSGLVLSYFSGLPALPDKLFSSESMQGGPVTVIAPNIVIGPRPTETEFSTYLLARGIKIIGYVGPCNEEAEPVDKQFVSKAHLQWVCFQEKNVMIDELLKKQGPWYLYGPGLSAVYMELKQRTAQLMPKDPILKYIGIEQP